MRAHGFTLLEVLITLIILAVGMLGLANLQSKIHITEIESYQRAQAVLLLQDMVDRINSNRLVAASYVAADPFGTGDAYDDGKPDEIPADCTGAYGPTRDQCEWSEALRGASEVREVGGAAQASGAMIGARGCITLEQAANNNPGVCTPGIYRVTVAWQGLHRTKSPSPGLTCGEGEYGDDAQRRAVSTTLSIGLPRCASS